MYRVLLARPVVQAFLSQRVAADFSACVRSQRARRWATLGNLRCRWAMCCNSVGASDRAANASLNALVLAMVASSKHLGGLMFRICMLWCSFGTSKLHETMVGAMPRMSADLVQFAFRYFSLTSIVTRHQRWLLHIMDHSTRGPRYFPTDLAPFGYGA